MRAFRTAGGLAAGTLGLLILWAGPAAAQRALIPQQCRWNNECAAGLVCGPGGYCQDQCREDRDCVDGQRCVRDFHILPGGGQSMACRLINGPSGTIAPRTYVPPVPRYAQPAETPPPAREDKKEKK